MRPAPECRRVCQHRRPRQPAAGRLLWRDHDGESYGTGDRGTRCRGQVARVAGGHGGARVCHQGLAHLAGAGRGGTRSHLDAGGAVTSAAPSSTCRPRPHHPRSGVVDRHERGWSRLTPRSRSVPRPTRSRTPGPLVAVGAQRHGRLRGCTGRDGHEHGWGGRDGRAGVGAVAVLLQVLDRGRRCRRPSRLELSPRGC